LICMLYNIPYLRIGRSMLHQRVYVLRSRAPPFPELETGGGFRRREVCNTERVRGADINFPRLDYTLPQDRALHSAPGCLCEEPDRSYFPWIMFSENPGKRSAMVLHNPASPRDFDPGFAIHSRF
jgi:hypothetical protein